MHVPDEFLPDWLRTRPVAGARLMFAFLGGLSTPAAIHARRGLWSRVREAMRITPTREIACSTTIAKPKSAVFDQGGASWKFERNEGR
jgi:hypothetical protein